MSFVNVGVTASASAAAATGCGGVTRPTASTDPPTPEPTTIRRIVSFIEPLWIRTKAGPKGPDLLHNHFHVSVGPAALETSAAFTRLVVCLYPHSVLAGRAERRGRAGALPW